MFQRMDLSGQQRMAARDTRRGGEGSETACSVTHHSAQRGEWRDLYEASRGQRTASAEAPREKSAQLGPHSRSELGADTSPSTPAVQLEGFFTDVSWSVDAVPRW